MPSIEVIVAVDAQSAEEFGAVASTAESLGLHIHPDGRMLTVGVLAGTIEQSAIERLEKIPGVVSVEQSRTVRITPADRKPR